MKIIKITIIILFLQSSLTYECSNLGIFDQKYATELGSDSFKRLFVFAKLKGEGAFGKIKKIKFGGRIVTAKEISLPKKHNEFHQMKQMVQKEIDLFALVGTQSKKYFPEFIDCVYDSSDKETLKFWIIQENLQTDFKTIQICDEFIKKFSPLQRIEKYIQLMKGLREIHNNGYAHEDLKLENVMTDDSEFSNLKIIDMGLACKFTDIVMGGSPLFNSPEKIDRQPKCSTKHDIWALALVIVSIESKKSFVFKGLSDTCFSTVFNEECHTKLLTNIGTVMNGVFGNTSRFTKSIKKMISFNPNDRPEINEILIYLYKMDEEERNNDLMNSINNSRKKFKKDKDEIVPNFIRLEKPIFTENVKDIVAKEYAERKKRENSILEGKMKNHIENNFQDDEDLLKKGIEKLNYEKYNRLNNNQVDKQNQNLDNKQKLNRYDEILQKKSMAREKLINQTHHNGMENKNEKKIFNEQPVQNYNFIKKNAENNMFHKNRGFNPITGQAYIII